jgi:NAD(P)-dependent dehydrogenase (short-subunit alcohol dehydrogenase family)
MASMFPEHKELPRLNGFPVIVTGAARGIGRAIAFGLLRAGARVAMVDRAEHDLNQCAVEARAVATADAVVPICADITRPEDVQRIIERTVAAFGGIYGLVNNAGIGRFWLRQDFLTRPIRFWELEPEQWRRFIDVNANGFFQMTHAVIGHLLQQGRGRVITVTTSIDTMIRGGSVGYGGSKAAIEASMATLAEDLIGRRVTANVVVPGGPVNTPAMPDDGVIPRSAFIQAEVMVPPIAWLLSDEAADVSGRRFIAARWDPSLPGKQASLACGDPIGWPQLGGQTRFPDQLLPKS